MKKDLSWKQLVVIYILIIAGIILFDQLVKYASLTQLAPLPGGTAPFIPGFIRFFYTENTGAAFSLFSGKTWILGIVSSVMAGVMIYLLYRYRSVKSWLFRVALCFIIGGAIGNVIDRFFRGFVVDMLEFEFVNFAIFNVADAFVCVGAVMLGVFLIWFWDKAKKDGNESTSEHAES